MMNQQEIKDRLAEMAALKEGWAGYQGRPTHGSLIQQCTIDCVASFLEGLDSDEVPTPSIVPGYDGTLQIEWHVNGCDLEIEITEPNLIDISIDTQQHPVDLAGINGWIRKLISEEEKMEPNVDKAIEQMTIVVESVRSLLEAITQKDLHHEIDAGCDGDGPVLRCFEALGDEIPLSLIQVLGG